MKKFKFSIRGSQYDVELKKMEGNIAEIEVNGTSYSVEIHKEIKTTKTPTIVRTDIIKQDQLLSKVPSPAKSTPVKAPLPGNIISVKVKAGEQIKKGDIVVVMEAMKMENNVLSEKDGLVTKVFVQAGQNVLQNDTLIEIE